MAGGKGRNRPGASPVPGANSGGLSRAESGQINVAGTANFVIPYPPGFPIMVPGQVITEETITFMRRLDIKEIHGCHAAQGLKLLKPDVLATRKTNGGLQWAL
jgi:hypothetical protein